MKKYISAFHYLTQDGIPDFSPLDQVKMACEAGAKWIQYRVFPRPIDQWLEEVNTAAIYCDDWGVTLSINDNVEVAALANDIQAVHLGRSDMHPFKAREILGMDKVIGGSALTIEDVLFYVEAEVDYISIGPVNYTETKVIHKKPLGIEGINAFLQEIKNAIPNFSVPIIVAGGITLLEVQPLLAMPIAGIAVSSAINLSKAPSVEFKSFYNKIY